MEQNCIIYRDPETGKIRQHVGGQDPIEIDGHFAKILHPDVDSLNVYLRSL